MNTNTPPFFPTIILSHHKYPHIMIIVALTFFILSLLLFQINESFIIEWNLTSINSTSFSFPILLENSSILFIFTVSFISFNVLLFSNVYIAGDANLQRFTQIVILFIGSIIILILCPNTMIILLGWDGLGITSFLLVIYYQNSRSLNSGFITLATNRIGDCLILFSIAIIISQGQWNIFNIWNESIYFTSLLSILILFAAITNSAQFPFIAWLTCAIAAPTPVSALVHSSTLVTAGVFLLIRFYSFLSEFVYFNPILIWTGIITIFISAAWAISNNDIKETIALSTISQLGLIISTLSLGITNICFFHLLTHAMFNATIFIAAGIVITFNGHQQSFANINMNTHSRTSAIAIITSIVSINAIFFMAGYYSNDSILETIWYSPSLFIWVLFYFLSTAITAVYSTRLWRGAVTNNINPNNFFRKSVPHNSLNAHIISNNFTIAELPLLLMTLISAFIGSTSVWLLTTPSDSPIVPNELEVFAPIAVLMGVIIAFYSCSSNNTVYHNEPSISGYMHWLYPSLVSFSTKPLNSDLDASVPEEFVVHSQEIFSQSPLFNYSGNPNNLINRMKLLNVNNRPTTEFIYTNYNLANPFINISHFLENILDLGAYNLLGPSTILFTLPFLTPQTLNFQENNINNILITIILLTVLGLPIII